jgi:hypothetical protein
VFLAVGYSILATLKSLACTLRTDQLFRLSHNAFIFIMLLLILLLLFLLPFFSLLSSIVNYRSLSSIASTTLSMPSKVWLLALKAFIVVQMVEGKLLQVIVVLTLRILEPLVKVHAFMLSPQHALVYDLPFLLPRLTNQICEPRMTRSIHPLIARRTVSILQAYD